MTLRGMLHGYPSSIIFCGSLMGTAETGVAPISEMIVA
jgi:hypothetical protein